MPVFFTLFLGTLVLDQLTKTIVRHTMHLGSEIPLLPFFSLTHVDNTGIAFGLFQEKNFFFIAIGLAVTAFLVVYALRLLRTDRMTALALAVIIGGALGNLIDRMWLGHVTDFLDFYIGPHHWPVFNVADSAICCGAALVALRGLLDWRAGLRR